MTNGHIAGWRRLQRISLQHALQIAGPRKSFGRPRQISVPEVIRENVEILGRGTEEQVKARIMWYLTFHPKVFAAS